MEWGEIEVGIDPGINGAIVALHLGEPVQWTMMPTYMVGKHNRVNCAALANFFQDLSSTTIHVNMELVGAMPNQGVVSMFSFGHAVGSVMGVLGALEIPCKLIRPQEWKKSEGIIGLDKDAARSKAIQYWPQWRELDKKIKGQALADAALIAKYKGD